MTLVVCEGETERIYFLAIRDLLRLRATEVVLPENTDGSAPISVVECAERHCRNSGDYDHVYCVIDRDGHESFARARDWIRGLANRGRRPLPIKEAVSIPCFEIWSLLHFERTDKPYPNCGAVVNRIVAQHYAGYRKADKETARYLVQRLEAAIDNAEWLATRDGIEDGNPSTSVHELVKHLKNVADME